jgi:hypothetical protein
MPTYENVIPLFQASFPGKFGFLGRQAMASFEFPI